MNLPNSLGKYSAWVPVANHCVRMSVPYGPNGSCIHDLTYSQAMLLSADLEEAADKLKVLDRRPTCWELEGCPMNPAVLPFPSDRCVVNKLHLRPIFIEIFETAAW